MSLLLPTREREYTVAHIFCGLGGGKKGFARGQARVGHLRGTFRTIGGVDSDAAAIADFNACGPGCGTVMDLFSREQYTAFHGHEPPASWEEVTVRQFRCAFGGEYPDVVFGSAPCKGFSGLLPEKSSKSVKYQALNGLALRGLQLGLEAWQDDPPAFWLWENVPRIQTRGRAVLDEMIALIESFGYVCAPTTHDCGELGGLAQSRRRFLLVCRHPEKVPPFLYEPPRRRLLAVGDVLGKMPRPGDVAAGPMHRMGRLQWRTWVRLAFVRSGSDWRSLKELRVVDGVLADYGLVPGREWYRTALGVTRWDEPAGTITSEARPQNGAFAVADPRPTYTGEYSQLGVNRWTETVGAVSSQSEPGGGAYSVADPRLGDGPSGPHFNNVYRVVRFTDPSPAITAGASPSSGGLAVADPRTSLDRVSGDNYLSARHYGVLPWDSTAQAITSSAGHDNGAFSVADPRLPDSDARHLNQWRVESWDKPPHTVIGATRPGSGALTVADPRPPLVPDGPSELPALDTKLVAVIRALDGTWHRPFTTLELAALQSLVDPEEYLELHGASDTAWRERIGNAVPPAAAEAIANVMAEALLLAEAGETFQLSAQPIWVQPIVVAIALDRAWREEATA